MPARPIDPPDRLDITSQRSHATAISGSALSDIDEGLATGVSTMAVPLLASMLQHIVFTYGFNLNVAKRLVADLTPEQMCQQPHGVVNHPAWSLGHLAAASVGILRALGHDASLPAAWGDVFKTGGIPSADPSVYPPKEELLATYEALHAQVAAAVTAADAATLAQAHPNEGTRKYFPTVGDMIVFLMTAHEMDHLGQLAAWRRALGLAAPARA